MNLIKKLWKGWLRIAKPIGDFQAQVFFSIFYIIFLSILGIVFRLFSDPLSIKQGSKGKKSMFTVWRHVSENSKTARRQF